MGISKSYDDNSTYKETKSFRFDFFDGLYVLYDFSSLQCPARFIPPRTRHSNSACQAISFIDNDFFEAQWCHIDEQIDLGIPSVQIPFRVALS